MIDKLADALAEQGYKALEEELGPDLGLQFGPNAAKTAQRPVLDLLREARELGKRLDAEYIRVLMHGKDSWQDLTNLMREQRAFIAKLEGLEK